MAVAEGDYLDISQHGIFYRCVRLNALRICVHSKEMGDALLQRRDDGIELKKSTDDNLPYSAGLLETPAQLSVTWTVSDLCCPIHAAWPRATIATP
jgi:hypothetical protein